MKPPHPEELPKLYEEENPIRALINSTNSPSCTTAKATAKYFNEYFNFRTEYNIKNTTPLNSKLEKVKTTLIMA